jgi:mono/diheme cytochrome c family protein
MKKTILILFLYAGWLAACSTGTEVTGVSAENGQALFQKAVLGGSAGCATCHALEPGAILVGPSLAGIGSQAGERVDSLSAEEYLRQSILKPDDHLAEGFPAGVMPKTYQENLNQDEIESLVAYLISLK